MKLIKKPLLQVLAFSFIFILTSFEFSGYSNLKNKKIISHILDDEELLRQKWDNALGTFQIQIINSRLSPQIHVSIIEEIEKNRMEDKISYIPYKDNIRIMILPKSMIKGDFTKLELFAYISQ